MRKYLSSKELGIFAKRLSLGAGGAHLWYFGFSRKKGCRGRLCTGAAIPWAGELPYRYITPGVIGRACGSGERWGVAVGR